MNGNNDNERPRISSRDASPNHVKSAFVRRDDGPLAADDEMTSDAYLRSIAHHEPAPAPRASVAEDIAHVPPARAVEEPVAAPPVPEEPVIESRAPISPAEIQAEPVAMQAPETAPIVVAAPARDVEEEPVVAVANAEEPVVPVESTVVEEPIIAEDREVTSKTTSVLTRDAARLRSIMRQVEPGTERVQRTQSAAPASDRSEPLQDSSLPQEPATIEPAEEIPLPAMPMMEAPRSVVTDEAAMMPAELDAASMEPTMETEPAIIEADTIVEPETSVAESEIVKAPAEEPVVAETEIPEAAMAEPVIAEAAVAEMPVVDPLVAETAIEETPVIEATSVETAIEEPAIEEAQVVEAVVAETPVLEAPSHVRSTITELDEMMVAATATLAAEPRIESFEVETEMPAMKLNIRRSDAAATESVDEASPAIDAVASVEERAEAQSAMPTFPSGEIPVPGEIIAAISDELRLVRRTVSTRTQEIPAPPPITEEARKAATKLKAPEPRRSDVAISRPVRLGASRGEEKRANGRTTQAVAQTATTLSGAATMQSVATTMRGVSKTASTVDSTTEMARIQASAASLDADPLEPVTSVVEAPTRLAAAPRAASRPEMHAEIGHGGRPPRPMERVERESIQREPEWIDERPTQQRAMAADERPTQQRTPTADVPPATPRPRQEIVDPYDAEFQQKKKLVIAVTSVTLGVIIALGLYAGGGDAITGMFSNKSEGINKGPRVTSVMTSTMPLPEAAEHRDETPARERAEAGSAVGTDGAEEPTKASSAESRLEKPAAEKPTAQAATAEKSGDAAASSKAEKSGADKASEEKAKAEKMKAEKAKAEKAKAEKAKADKADKAKAEKAKADKEKKLAAAGEKKKESASSTTSRDKDAKGDKEVKKGTEKYTVQVRATTDESEAKRLAAKLKAKGMKGVTVVTSGEKDKKLYRIRFGSYTSPADAKSAAGRTGIDGTWVIKQR